MPSTFTRLFRKELGCPSSESLLAYHQFRLGFKKTGYIETHLASCEFCYAELQLLSRHCNDAEEYAFAEMPAQLRRLAEGLLRTSAAPFKGLAKFREHYQA